MGLTLNKDPNTGIELEGLYYRLDKINFNDFNFQVVITGYASQKAHQEGNLPVAQPRAVTWDYSKEDLLNVNIFEYAYTTLKLHPDFHTAEDVFEAPTVSQSPYPELMPTNNQKDTADQSHLLNINTATFDELLTLTGVGEARANEIIEYRKIHGEFVYAEDLAVLDGFGEKLYDGLKNEITV